MTEKSQFPKYIFGWKGAVALVAGAVASVFVMSSLAIVLMMGFGQNVMYSDAFLILSNTLMWCGAIACFDLLVCRPQTGQKLNFNFSTKNFYTYLLVFPMMFGMMLIAESVTNCIPTTGPFWGKLYNDYSQLLDQISKDPSVMLVMAVIMAPIFEEIVFRGIILKGLLNNKVSPLKAIVFSALIFGLVHGNPWQFTGAFLLGLVLGLVYYKTKSLLLPVLLHGFNNLVSTLQMVFTDTESFSQVLKVPEWTIFLTGIIIFSVFCYLFTQKYRVSYSE